MKYMLLLALLACSLASHAAEVVYPHPDWSVCVTKTVYPAMNPDGYIGGLTLGVAGNFSMTSPWQDNTTSAYTTTFANSPSANQAVSASSVTTQEHQATAYGLGVDLRLPVTENLTLLGSLDTTENLLKVSQLSQIQSNTVSTISTNSSADSSFLSYSVHLGARYYFKNLW